MADVTDSKSVGSDTVWVQVPPPALFMDSAKIAEFRYLSGFYDTAFWFMAAIVSSMTRYKSSGNLLEKTSCFTQKIKSAKMKVKVRGREIRGDR